ncbi:hypothetical protein GCM10009716_17660 [Streptomyces sodiiphilus]|uniref:Class IIb bacteriocin, lactobin A/cerein 7B family n=1 Tax=Streptomyces sodiiphilus TaxID=226217 RepID=A0ABN2P069_9ACTN
MLEEKMNQMAELGSLEENSPGVIVEEASPVLATPATALAFTAGAGVVTGAYALGRAIG